MDHELVAKRMAELGHSTRLAVFRLLVKAGKEGMPVGEVQQRLDIAGPTLSHHLRRLMSAGLIRQQRDGRTLYCIAELEALREVMAFFEAECCTL